ncbi:MAG: hypothetical protein RRY29_08070 [Desulfovibrionaceae bacterium]
MSHPALCCCFSACVAPLPYRVKLCLFLCLCGVLALLVSCADSPMGLSVSGNFSNPYQVQIDQWVRRNPPAVYVQPTVTPDHAPRALFVPLRITQDMNNRLSIGNNISRQIWQVWLSQQAFSVLEYTDTGRPFSAREAIALGRQRGAELVVGGYITHFMDGSSYGDSSVSLAIEVYEVATGTLLWSMAQGATMEKQAASDFYVFQVNSRMPADPVSLIVRTLADDMGKPLVYWVHPDRRPKGWSLSHGKAF